MKIVKRDGRLVDFDPQRIYRSCVGAGAMPEAAADTASHVASRVHEGMTTEEIRRLVLARLQEEDSGAAEAYRFYDLPAKGRIVLLYGEVVQAGSGTLYLGGRARRLPLSPVGSAGDVEALLEWLEDDIRYGVPRRVIAARLRALRAAVSRAEMSDEERGRALSLIDAFRRRLGWPPATSASK